MPQDKTTTVESIFVAGGLADQDDHIDLLEDYYTEMQKVTVEPSKLHLDFLTFASCVDFFGVATLRTTTTTSSAPTTPPVEIQPEDMSDADADGEPEEESESVYPISAPTTPPASTIASSIASGDLSARDSPSPPPFDFDQLSPEEKLARWQEAFEAKINDTESGSDDANDLTIQEEVRRTFDFSPIVPTHQDKGKAPERDDVEMAVDTDDFINWPEDKEEKPIQQDTVPLDWVEDIYPSDQDVAHQYHAETEFGREYLQPQQFDTPTPELRPLPEDPKQKKMILDAAIKFRDELRAKRVKEYEETKRRKAAQARSASMAMRNRRFPSPPAPPSRVTQKPIGIIYLSASQNFDDPLQAGEMNMGFYSPPEYRDKPEMVGAVKQVIDFAFKDPACHRLQVSIVEHEHLFETQELFTNAGFMSEGKRRLGFRSFTEFKDVFYFSMLAIDYVNSKTSIATNGPQTLWDDLFKRHQREREDLVRLERKSFRRMGSNETIREASRLMAEDYSTDTESTYSSARSYSSRHSSSRHSSSPLPNPIGAAGFSGSPAGSPYSISSPSSDRLAFSLPPHEREALLSGAAFQSHMDAQLEAGYVSASSSSGDSQWVHVNDEF